MTYRYEPIDPMPVLIVQNLWEIIFPEVEV
jgi:hypothetical protein